MAVSQNPIQPIIDQLTPGERFVLARRFGLDGNNPGTLQAIASEMLVTRERVRQLEATALRKMRNPSRIRALEEIKESLHDGIQFHDYIHVSKPEPSVVLTHSMKRQIEAERIRSVFQELYF